MMIMTTARQLLDGTSFQRRLWRLCSLIVFMAGIAVLPASNAAETSVPNIHAILVSSSRYWFNYRHAMNALGIYHILQENGIPNSQIVLMIADEYVINARNPFKNGMYANGVNPEGNWYSEETELDYRGSDVTVQNFFDAVLGIGPKSLRNTNEDSHLLIFVTGHGGDQFFKFQDEEEMTAQDIANLMDELAARKKFRKALFIADTCQAFTLFDKVKTPNVYALGTSLRGENAYAHHSDVELGLSVIERWTHGFMTQYKKRPFHPATTTLHDLMVRPFEGKTALGAHVGVLGDFRELLLHEFFGTPPRSSKNQGVNQQRSVLPLPIQSASTNITPTNKRIISSTTTDANSSDKTKSEEEQSQNTHETESSTLTHPFEPTDLSFGLLVGGLIVLIVSASQFGKSTVE